ncbi:MAG: hypothetical protein AAFR55_08020 [Pseudomonadota bacterium]
MGVGHGHASDAGGGALAASHCKVLQGERDQLAERGVADHLRQGPRWAQQNLTPEQIGRVGTFIKLEEQLKFRCPVGFDNDVVTALRDNTRIERPALPTRPAQEVRARRARLLAEAAQREAAAARAAGVPLPVRNERRGTGSGAARIPQPAQRPNQTGAADRTNTAPPGDGVGLRGTVGAASARQRPRSSREQRTNNRANAVRRRTAAAARSATPELAPTPTRPAWRANAFARGN